MSNKVFIDTNIFIRFLTRDNEPAYEDCVKLFQHIDAGKIRPYTSQVVILEIIFVLTRIYGFSKDKVLALVTLIFEIRNITIIESTHTKQAVKLFEKYHIKYQDCLIASQIPRGCILLTYDKEFHNVPNLSIQTPQEAIK